MITLAVATALVLPGPAAPGAVNPAVTQATIARTICVSGWTATVRPPSSYTTRLKAAQIVARHLPGSVHDYEEDHLIPLELGGSPRSPLNLWPEPEQQASVSDPLENRLHAEVCAGRMRLAVARRMIILWKRVHG